MTTTTITRNELTDDQLGDCVEWIATAYGHAVLDQLVEVDEIVAFLSRLGTTTTTETDPVSWQIMARDAASQLDEGALLELVTVYEALTNPSWTSELSLAAVLRELRRRGVR